MRWNLVGMTPWWHQRPRQGDTKGVCKVTPIVHRALLGAPHKVLDCANPVDIMRTRTLSSKQECWHLCTGTAYTYFCVFGWLIRVHDENPLVRATHFEWCHCWEGSGMYLVVHVVHAMCPMTSSCCFLAQWQAAAAACEVNLKLRTAYCRQQINKLFYFSRFFQVSMHHSRASYYTAYSLTNT